MPIQARFTFVACVVACLSVSLPCFAVENHVETAMLLTAPTNLTAATPYQESRPVLPLTLESALQRMLAKNRQLQAQQHAVSATQAQGEQSSLLPNPELSFEFEEFAGSGDYSGTDVMQSSLSLSQVVELGGKRARRQQRAEQQSRVAQQQLAVTRSNLINTTIQRFIAVLVAQKQLRLAQNQLNQATEVLATVNEGVAAGKNAPIEALRFKSLATGAQIRYQKALTTLDNQRMTLASSWHSSQVDFTEVEGNVRLLPSLPPWGEIEAQLANTPLLILQKQQQQLAQAELSLQRANRINNITVELGLKSDRSNDDTALLAGLSMPLALFDRNQGAIAAASSRVSQVDAAAEALRQQQRQQVRTTYNSATLIRQEIEALTSDLIPTAQAVYEALSYGYSQGKFGVIEVLDAQGRLFDNEDRYIEALTRYHQQYCELDRLLGSEFTADKG